MNVLVESDRSPFPSVGGCRVGGLVARQDDVPPGCHLVVQGEVTGTGGLQSNLCLFADLHAQTHAHTKARDKYAGIIKPWRRFSRLECSFTCIGLSFISHTILSFHSLLMHVQS